MNNKGDKLISVYWFAILIIVAVGIYAMIATYYSFPTDVRQWEAEILANKVADCISQEGRLNPELLKDGEFVDDFKTNFLTKCSLILEPKQGNQFQYYIEVNFYKVENLQKSVFDIAAGEGAWKDPYLSLQTGDKTYERVFMGDVKRFYSLDDKNNQILVEVLSVVRKTEQNVKI